MKHLISIAVIISVVLLGCGGKKTKASDEQIKKTKIEAEEAFEELEGEKYKE